MPTASDSSGKLRILVEGVLALVDVLVEPVKFEARAGPPIMEMTPVDVAPLKVRMRAVPLISI